MLKEFKSLENHKDVLTEQYYHHIGDAMDAHRKLIRKRKEMASEKRPQMVMVPIKTQTSLALAQQSSSADKKPSNAKDEKKLPPEK